MRRSGRVGKDMEQEVDLGGPPAEEGLGKGGVRSEGPGWTDLSANRQGRP